VGDAGSLRLVELAANGTDYIEHAAPDAIGASVRYVWPVAPTISGQQLESTTAGALSWGGMVNVQATNTSAPTITQAAAAANLQNWTETLDTASAFNPTTGVFTTPAGQGGFYAIEASIQWAATAADIAVRFEISIAVNGTIVRTWSYTNPVAALAQLRTTAIACKLQLAAGDTVSIQPFLTANGAGNIALTNSALLNYLSIARISA